MINADQLKFFKPSNLLLQTKFKIGPMNNISLPRSLNKFSSHQRHFRCLGLGMKIELTLFLLYII